MQAATRLASHLMRICSETTVEGTIWPVDANLRPEGRNGPLVRTLSSHLAYYQRWAKTWEFQALLKARPVAGRPRRSAQEYVDALAPLVWQAAERENFVPDVQKMRRRVVENIPVAEIDRELKLGPGGLRDVEFAVQLLQLVHGRTRRHAAQRHHPGRARRRWPPAGTSAARTRPQLDEAYRFLRTMEHRIQLYRLRRTHLVPEDEADLRRLGRSLGLRTDPVAELTRSGGGTRSVVRRLHEKLFYRPLLDAVAQLDARRDPAQLRRRRGQRLEALGYADPAAALRHLEALASGVTRKAAIQRTLLPVLLGWFADSADPDAGLLGFRKVSDALGKTPWYLRLLRDEGAAAENLARVLSAGRLAPDLLLRAPEAVALLGDPEGLRAARPGASGAGGAGRGRPRGRRGAGGRRGPRGAPARAVPYGGRGHHRLVRHRGAAPPSTTTGALVDRGRRRRLRPQRGDHRGRAARRGPRHLGRRAAHPLRRHRHGPLRRPRAGLRLRRRRAVRPRAAARASTNRRPPRPRTPWPTRCGGCSSCPPPTRRCSSTPTCARRASPARWCAPSPRTPRTTGAGRWSGRARRCCAPSRSRATRSSGARFIELIDPLRYPAEGLGDDAVREIRRLKARMESERLPRGADPTLHTKLGRGGLSDVEWTVQLLQMRHGWAEPGLRTTRTREALAAAHAADLIGTEDAQILDEAWVLATRVRNAVMLVRGRAGRHLPLATARELAAVGRYLGYGPGHVGEMLDDYRRTTRRARAVVEELFYDYED